ncbi:hypothetical protein SUGI_0935670 [Cryptomeria japonica]|nr:hypothetical protein SUGI_0935670 [Cryptomeria japonica]
MTLKPGVKPWQRKLGIIAAHGMGYLVIWQSKHNLQEKCQQGWTKKLDNFMDALSSMESPLHLLAVDASVEGPYGPPSMEFLRHDALILIGGGSGIAPLMSTLSETLHQHDIKEGNHVPREVLLIW